MKILIVTQYFWPEQFKINDLCIELAERGHDVTVYTGLPNYPAGAFFKGFGLLKGPYHQTFGKIKIIRVPMIARGPKKSFRLALNYFSYFFMASCLAPFLVRGKFDRIFVYQPSPVTVGIPGVLLKYLKRAPLFFWVSDLWPETLQATGVVNNKTVLSIIQKFVLILYNHSDRVLVTSRGFYQKIETLGISSKKLLYWPQWSDDFAKTPLGDLNDSRLPSGFIIMFAGNIGTSQDFPTIVKAAKILEKESHIHFVILGDGLMRSWAEQQIKELGLEKNFHFLGRKSIESMPYYFSKADVLLISLTDTELFSITIPGKLQSYLASGKPILASLNGEGAEIIKRTQAGITCPASQPEKLAEAALFLSKLSKEEIKKMGARALSCYQKEFDKNTVISLLEKELESFK